MPAFVVIAALGVLAPRTVNLSDGEAAAAIEVFTSALQQEGVDGQVEWSLVRLENHILFDAHVGDRHVEMTATSLDDLPSVARRVARALATGQSLEETRTPRSVTGVEAKAPNRTYTEHSGGLFLMPVMPFARDVRMETSIEFGIDVRLDKTGHFYQADFGFMLPTFSTDRPGLGGVFADLGAALNLSDDNTAPYAGGGISGRIIGGFGDVVVGLAPYASLGVTFDRSSSSRFYVEARAAQNVIPLTSEDDLGQRTKHYVTEFGGRVGLLF